MNYFTSIYIALVIGLIGYEREIPLPLCDEDISLLIHGNDDSPVLLYNMHDNENTSAVAGRLVSKRYGGQYFELKHTGQRNITFYDGDDSLYIDPNRIYTDAGIWQQLERNDSQDTFLFETIAAWRDSLLNILEIDGRKLVIALHNNTNQFYSVASYEPGGEYEKEAHSVFEGRVRDKDDFYFVTDPDIFMSLIKGRYHVILQANETMTDDGSLSVYCGARGIPYINVETQHKHLFRQIRMLIFAFQKLVPTAT